MDSNVIMHNNVIVHGDYNEKWEPHVKQELTVFKFEGSTVTDSSLLD